MLSGSPPDLIPSSPPTGGRRGSGHLLLTVARTVHVHRQLRAPACRHDMPQTGCDQQHRRVAVGKSPHHASPTPDLAHDPLQRIGRADLHPRFCDWPKQARCKAREVQVYAHSASPLNAADYLFSTIPKGLRIGCFSLQMWLSHFGAKDGQLHCISTCLCAARYKYLPILIRKIWDKNRFGNGFGTSLAVTRIPRRTSRRASGRSWLIVKFRVNKPPQKRPDATANC